MSFIFRQQFNCTLRLFYTWKPFLNRMIKYIPAAMARKQRVEESEKYDVPTPESEFKNTHEPTVFWTPKTNRTYKATPAI
ncbi:hypothetical protein BJV82DRAFT_597462 [Fennellomyces sp. T-0311]|nr:hypothetical protein BJV82DRAFT_597462 [Fennellomyces sp. T-0311]